MTTMTIDDVKIKVITRTQYNRMKKERDKKRIKGFLLLAGENGCFYRCEEANMSGIKAMYALQKKIQDEKTEQLTMF